MTTNGHPDIDLSDAARAYGLSYVPPVVWDMDEHGQAQYGAGFSPDDKTIHASEWFFAQDLTDPYDESRFKSAGAPRLDASDARRFVLAHELWHAAQYERDPVGTLLRGPSSGDPNHDERDDEQSADKHAATVYRLVRINGRASGELRGPREISP